MTVGGVHSFLLVCGREFSLSRRMRVCVMLDPYFARESAFLLPSIPQCPEIHWRVIVLVLSFNFEYNVRNLLISIDVLMFLFTTARIAGFQAMKRTVLPNLPEVTKMIR